MNHRELCDHKGLESIYPYMHSAHMHMQAIRARCYILSFHTKGRARIVVLLDLGGGHRNCKQP